jgi:hypothetical protein
VSCRPIPFPPGVVVGVQQCEGAVGSERVILAQKPSKRLGPRLTGPVRHGALLKLNPLEQMQPARHDARRVFLPFT